MIFLCLVSKMIDIINWVIYYWGITTPAGAAPTTLLTLERNLTPSELQNTEVTYGPLL